MYFSGLFLIREKKQLTLSVWVRPLLKQQLDKSCISLIRRGLKCVSVFSASNVFQRSIPDTRKEAAYLERLGPPPSQAAAGRVLYLLETTRPEVRFRIFRLACTSAVYS
jgi:hypothetical protein